MNSATVVTRKDARTLSRLHAALADMLGSMDGLLTRKRKRKAAPRRKRPTTRETAPAASKAQSPLAKAKAKAAKLAQVVPDEE